MTITLTNQDFELSEKLRVISEMEKQFRQPMNSLFTKIQEGTVVELCEMLVISAKYGDNGQFDKQNFIASILDEWDYSSIMQTCQSLIAHLLFSGTAEEQTKKIEKDDFFPLEMRLSLLTILHLPIPESMKPKPVLTGTES
jgi:hypothetical protein